MQKLRPVSTSVILHPSCRVPFVNTWLNGRYDSRMDAPEVGMRVVSGPAPDSQPWREESDTLSDVLEAVRLTGAVFFLSMRGHRGSLKRPPRPILGP